jgi:hypothetical protein
LAQIFSDLAWTTPQLQHFEPAIPPPTAPQHRSTDSPSPKCLDASVKTATMDAAAIQSCIVATLDADADVRRRAELQLKQVRPVVCVAFPPATLSTPPTSASAPVRQS